MDTLHPHRAAARRLGYSDTDRLLAVHADDVGMCHSANAASFTAMRGGLVTCGSLMAPCPWFPEAAAWLAREPELDLGIHLTLTSEWRHYRWRPIAPSREVPGLVDDEGFLWRSTREMRAHATLEEIETEARAQIELTLQSGVSPTHIDVHMGAFSGPEAQDVLLRLCREYKLVPPLYEPDDIDERTRRLASEGFFFARRVKGRGAPPSVAAYKGALTETLRSLPPGLSHITLHLNGDDEEIRHVTDGWEKRYIEFRAFTDSDVRAVIEDEGIVLVGYREINRAWAALQT